MRERPTVGRIAKPADEDAVYELLLGLEKDNGLGYPHHENKVREAIRQGTEGKGGYVIVIANPADPSKFVASLGIHWGQFWYSTDSYLAEVWLYVDPEYRKRTPFADILMDWAKWFSEALNEAAGREIPFILSVSSRNRLEAKRRWWRRRGEEIGAFFLLR